MKTFLECLHEAADQKDFWRVAELTDSFDDGDKELLQKAADIYASQSNSHIASVVRPEVEGAKAGRTVGKRSVGKSRAGGFTGPTICLYCDSPEDKGHETWCPELRG